VGGRAGAADVQMQSAIPAANVLPVVHSCHQFPLGTICIIGLDSCGWSEHSVGE